MKNFQRFELQNADFIYGGDLIITGYGDDLYDTEREKVIIID